MPVGDNPGVGIDDGQSSLQRLLLLACVLINVC